MVNEVAETPTRHAGGVQSLHRALDVVELVAARGGHLSIAEIAATTELPLPTSHRLLQTLVERGYMRRLPNRQYALGFRLIPLGAAAESLRVTGATTVLADLVASTGESANLAVLSGDSAEYVAQAPSNHSMRMFTEVGRRVDLHCSGVGKAMLAQLGDAEVDAIARRVGLTAHTAHTHTSMETLMSDLSEIRDRGYAVDEQEREVGVRCVAVALPPAAPGRSAVSISGPVTRMTDELIARAVPLLQAAARQLTAKEGNVR